MDEIKNACVVSIEVDGRQAYIFETDKLQERLGASRILDNMREQAEGLARKSSGKVMIYSPVSGAIGAWAEKTNRSELLNFAWKLREWLAEHGVEHRIGYLETDKRHFTEPGNGRLPISQRFIAKWGSGSMDSNIAKDQMPAHHVRSSFRARFTVWITRTAGLRDRIKTKKCVENELASARTTSLSRGGKNAGPSIGSGSSSLYQSESSSS